MPDIPTPSYKFESRFFLQQCVTEHGTDVFRKDEQGCCEFTVGRATYRVDFEAKTVREGWRQKLRRFFTCCTGRRSPKPSELHKLFFPKRVDIQVYMDPDDARQVVRNQQCRDRGDVPLFVGSDSNLEVFCELGSGGFGRVESVYNRNSSALMALKTPNGQEPLNGEVAMLDWLHHANIIQANPTLVSHGSMLMENGGAPLSKLCDRPLMGLSRNMFVSCCNQLMDAVTYIHDCNIGHRDIKPDNVLIDLGNGHIRLADFGLARFFGDHDFSQTICGSPDFIAPEVVRGDAYRTKADVYSLGCTLYEMLTGKLFRTYSEVEEEVYPSSITVIKSRLRNGLRRVPDFDAREKEAWVTLLAAMMDVNPTTRISTENAWSFLQRNFMKPAHNR